MNECLYQLGEKALLNRLKTFLPSGQIDNDTAKIQYSGKDFIVNSDVLVEDVHFSNKTTSAEDIGWRAVAANFSDLRASGLEEFTGITIGLITPPDTEWHWVSGVYQGIKSASKGIGADREVVFGNQSIPFVAGSRQEETSEQNGDSQPYEVEDVMAPGAGPEGKINRAATAEQEDRVDNHQSQAKRVGGGGHFFRIGSGNLIAQKHDVGGDQGAEKGHLGTQKGHDPRLLGRESRLLVRIVHLGGWESGLIQSTAFCGVQFLDL